MVDGSLVGTLLRLVVSLAVVLVLLVLLARYLGRRQLGAGGGAGAGRGRPSRRRPMAPVEVVSRHGLSRGSSLAVVRACGQLLLVGVTESSVTVLRELQEEPEPQDLLEPVVAGQPVEARGVPAHPATARGLSTQGTGAAGAVVETLREWTTRRG